MAKIGVIGPIYGRIFTLKIGAKIGPFYWPKSYKRDFFLNFFWFRMAAGSMAIRKNFPEKRHSVGSKMTIQFWFGLFDPNCAFGLRRRDIGLFSAKSQISQNFLLHRKFLLNWLTTCSFRPPGRKKADAFLLRPMSGSSKKFAFGKFSWFSEDLVIFWEKTKIFQKSEKFSREIFGKKKNSDEKFFFVKKILTKRKFLGFQKILRIFWA